MRGKPDSPATAPADPPVAADADLAGLNPPPESARALVAEPAPVPPPALDAHGFDPAGYQWLPVLRRPRSAACQRVPDPGNQGRFADRSGFGVDLSARPH